jgi:hypothetical protein
MLVKQKLAPIEHHNQQASKKIGVDRSEIVALLITTATTRSGCRSIWRFDPPNPLPVGNIWRSKVLVARADNLE